MLFSQIKLKIEDLEDEYESLKRRKNQSTTNKFAKRDFFSMQTVQNTGNGSQRAPILRKSTKRVMDYEDPNYYKSIYAGNLA